MLRKEGSNTRTSTIATYQGGSTPGTLVIEVPQPSTSSSESSSSFISSPSSLVTSSIISASSSSIPASPLYTTATSYIDGTSARTTTITTAEGTTPGTVLIESPRLYTTSTSYYDGTVPVTSTIATYGGGPMPGLVVIEQPRLYTTLTSYYEGSIASTTTQATYAGGSTPGTILVQSPRLYTTLTSYYDGTVPATSTIATYGGGSIQGTVVVEQPRFYTTLTSYYDGSVPATSTIATFGGGSTAGTVLVQEPRLYTTRTSYYDGSVPVTSTIATFAGGTTPGTVQVDQPRLYTTLTSYYDGSAASTRTEATYAGGTSPGVVVVEQPRLYTTLTSYYGGSAVTTTTQATYAGGSVPGTVLVQTPALYTTGTSYIDGTAASTTTVSPFTGGTAPGVVSVYQPRLYTTTTSYFNGTSGYTSTVATFAGGTTPGSVVVGVPYQTTTSYYFPSWTTNGTATSTVTPTGSGAPSIVVRQPVPTFPCARSAYLVRERTVDLLDVQTGNTAVVASLAAPGTGNFDALAYSIRDGYLYGVLSGSPSQLYVIGSNGNTSAVASLPAGISYTAGLIDDSGSYYAGGLRSSDGAHMWAQVDTTRTAYGQLLSNGASVNQPQYPAGDWSNAATVTNQRLGATYFVAFGFDASGQTYLMRWNPVSRTWATVGSYGVTATSISYNTLAWQAVYPAGDGTIYASEAVTGEIWSFTVDGSQTATRQSGGPIARSASFDGTRCMDNPEALSVNRPLSCSIYGYLLQDATIYAIDLRDGSQVYSRTYGNGQINLNGAGYNRLDGYIYGFYRVGTAQTAYLARLGSDGTVTSVYSSVPGCLIGDVDANGTLWGADPPDAQGNFAYVRFDYNAAQGTYLPAEQGTNAQAFNPGFRKCRFPFYDWTAVPNAPGYLFAIACDTLNNNCFLNRFSTVDKICDEVAYLPAITRSGSFGACYAADVDYLYCQNNGNGEIWRVSVQAPYNATLQSVGPTTANNDGARCPYAASF